MAKWLVEVAELPQYEQAFRQQHLDGSGLLRLTTDLRGRDEIHKVLGITDRVHRTQLLAAIRKLELANCRRRELEGPPHPPGHGLDSFLRLGDTVCAWAQPGSRLGR